MVKEWSTQANGAAAAAAGDPHSISIQIRADRQAGRKVGNAICFTFFPFCQFDCLKAVQCLETTLTAAHQWTQLCPVLALKVNVPGTSEFDKKERKKCK